MTDAIALIAGNGKLPFEFCKAVKSAGKKIFVIAIDGEADASLKNLADHFLSVKVGQFGKMIQALKKDKIAQVAFAGGIKKTRLFDGINFDLPAVALIAKAGSLKDDVILRKVAEEIEKNGTQVIPPTLYLPESVPNAGLLSKRSLSKQEQHDAKIAFEAAKGIGALDIGQSVVVHQGVVVAVEAVDGTDATILRAGKVAKTEGTWNPGKGAVLVKVSKPQQDLRFDLPSIGLQTIKNCFTAGITAIVLEAGKSVVLNREEVIDEVNNQTGALACF